MKRFKGTSKEGKVSENYIPQAAASYIGWGIAQVGYEVLDQLEVGDTTIDDDGDTWERVE